MTRGMPESSSRPLLIALLGPTASGKSRIAMEIAPSLNAEIVSVDSMQLYRGMDIGTAKVKAKNRRGIPHYLLDVADYRENFSVADFQKAGRAAIAEIAARNNLPFLVGGTGLYFEALVFDYCFPPGFEETEVREELESWARADPEGLRDKLREADPEFAASEGFRNIRRVVRAMEVFTTTGRPFSTFRKNAPTALYPWAGAALDPQRELLYRVIEERVDAMLEAGLVEEVAVLENEGPISKTARQALGYKEILCHLEGAMTLDEAVAEIKKRSRNYAKRQLTWLRRIKGLQWFELGEKDIDNPVLIGEKIRAYFEQGIKSIGDSPDYGAS
jgi:tRNA dimethylallyltransferase